MISIENSKFDPDELFRLANSGTGGEMPDAVQDILSEENKKELFRVLGDKKALEELLSSEKAQRLMKKFNSGK